MEEILFASSIGAIGLLVAEGAFWIFVGWMFIRRKKKAVEN